MQNNFSISFDTLNTNNYVGPEEVDFYRYKIKLIKLEPYPDGVKKIEDNNYKAIVMVSNLYPVADQRINPEDHTAKLEISELEFGSD